MRKVQLASLVIVAGLIIAGGRPASASLLNIGQYAQQIQEIQQIMSIARQPLDVGSVLGQFGSMYPGLGRVPSSPSELEQMTQQAAQQQMQAAEASMGTGAGEVGNQITTVGNSAMLDAASTAAEALGNASAAFGVPNPNPSLYVINQTLLSMMNQDAEANAATGQAAEAQAQYYAELAQKNLDTVAAHRLTTFGPGAPPQGI